MRAITPAELDTLALTVATALEQGEEARAWQLTRALEVAAGLQDGDDQPSGPVIGRRFARAHRRLHIGNDLRHALDREELRLAYQPQVTLRGNRLVGAEALLRWEHEWWGDVPVSDLISVAEEAGLIASLGEWVLRTACGQAMVWHESGL
jgi:hypothetical protein